MFRSSGNDLMHRNAGVSWPLISRVLADATYAARYRSLLGEALEGYLEPYTFAARARELHTLIRPFVVGESGERPTHTTLGAPGAFEPALDELIEHVRTREAFVRRELSLLVR
jgi:hypothetical protein